MAKTREPGELTRTMSVALVVTVIVLFAPLLTVAVMSFNYSPYGTLPFHFTTRWYKELFASQGLFDATWLSIQISLAVAATAAILGTTLAVWLVRKAKSGAIVVSGMLLSAITIPWLILGVAMLLVVNVAGLGRSILAIYLGCLATSLPYVVLIVAARLREIEVHFEDAARSLGATPLTVLRRIIVPMTLPSILGGALMAFMITFNNFAIQYFLAPFGVRTLPLEIYTLVRVGYRPDINALATILTVMTLIVVVILQRLGAGTRRMIAKR